LNNRSDVIARGALVVLPSFDPGWFGPSGAGRQVLIVIVLAAIAITALLVAGTAHLRNQRHRARRSDDEQLFTTTPLPVADQFASLARESPPYSAFSGLKIPRWVQAGSLIVALFITWGVARRVGPNNGAARGRNTEQQTSAGGGAPDVAVDSPDDVDLAPDSNPPPFRFRARDWVARNGGGCSGRLEVTQGEPSAWSLTARVHDSEGQLIETAHARVTALRKGDVVEFSFPRAECDRIGAWDVQGSRKAR
jgi:hypothetical protein